MAEAETLLRRAEDEEGEEARRGLEAALAALDRAPPAGAPGDAPRAAAYRAEALRRLGRLPEAARCYAIVLEAAMDDPQAVWEGLIDLGERLCGHEEVLRLATRASERWPGRTWQWDALAEQARRRLALERDAPISPEELARLRREVASRLESTPCRHDDDARPLTADAAAALGRDAGAVLAWVAALGACCCDCQVISVRGPREPT